VNLADLEDLGVLGEGKYAIVKRVKHRKTGVVMAIKVFVLRQMPWHPLFPSSRPG